MKLILKVYLILLMCLVLPSCDKSEANDFHPLRKSEQSIETLKDVLIKYYSAGNTDGFMNYLNADIIPKSIAHEMSNAISLAYNNDGLENISISVVEWSVYQNKHNLVGSVDGRPLVFLNQPEGVIIIESENTKQKIRYSLSSPYYSSEGKYRLCGIAFADGT